MRNTHLPLLLLASACAGTTTSPGEADNAPAAVKSADFDVRHQLTVKVPEGAQRVRIWFAYPQKEAAQGVSDVSIEAPIPHRLVKDSEGNEALCLEAEHPKAGDLVVVESFALTRREVKSGVSKDKARPLTEADRAEHKRFLQPNTHVVIDERIQKLAKEIVGDEQNPVVAARKLYDWTLNNVDYWVKDPKNKKASPVGSSVYCLENCTGNCTDFHSLWTALARAAGIPTRMVYGSFLKKELDGQDVDQSYHCWPEFFAPGIGWVPHDVAVADIFVGTFTVNADNATLVRRTTADGYQGPDAGKVDYYFGNLDERRVVWSSGRDLVFDPPQDGGPVNALPKAYVEIDGKPLAENKDTGWQRKLTYRERK
jgi:transglutaminase-like putative cysteine protease